MNKSSLLNRFVLTLTVMLLSWTAFAQGKSNFTAKGVVKDELSAPMAYGLLGQWVVQVLYTALLFVMV